MFQLEMRNNFVKVIKNQWFSLVSSEDFQLIIMILVLNDWLKKN